MAKLLAQRRLPRRVGTHIDFAPARRKPAQAGGLSQAGDAGYGRVNVPAYYIQYGSETILFGKK